MQSHSNFVSLWVFVGCFSSLALLYRFFVYIKSKILSVNLHLSYCPLRMVRHCSWGWFRGNKKARLFGSGSDKSCGVFYLKIIPVPSMRNALIRMIFSERYRHIFLNVSHWFFFWFCATKVQKNISYIPNVFLSFFK